MTVPSPAITDRGMACEIAAAEGIAPAILVLMGVSGSGKSTIALELQRMLGWPFQEGDDLQPPANVEKMRSGQPLDDQDRLPWLEAVARWIDRQLAKHQPGIITAPTSSAPTERSRSAAGAASRWST
jgi:adenylylsulfate kinase-like enzyme